MSITNSIIKLLNFKEENLIFNENFFEERNLKGKRCFIIKSYLFNSFDYCPKCGCINNNTIIKKGIYTSLIKINKISEITSYLELNKQIYKCKCCKHKFFSQTNIVDYGCHISNNVKLAILNCAKEIMSKSMIARLYNVSDNTVQDILILYFIMIKYIKITYQKLYVLMNLHIKRKYLHLIYVMLKLVKLLI